MEQNIDRKALIRAAFAAREYAYTPYSNFKVGAALLAKNGSVYTGCMTEFVKAMVGFDHATRDPGSFFAIAGTAFNDLTKSVIHRDSIGRAFMKSLHTTADMQ